MTEFGGANQYGTIFRLSLNGTEYLKLLDLESAASGSHPKGSLIYDGVYFYGLTGTYGLHSDGVIFKIKFDGSEFTKLYDFDGTNGRSPKGSLISDGTFLYGTTLSEEPTTWELSLKSDMTAQNSQNL